MSANTGYRGDYLARSHGVVLCPACDGYGWREQVNGNRRDCPACHGYGEMGVEDARLWRKSVAAKQDGG